MLPRSLITPSIEPGRADKVGQCKYVLIISDTGGIINDPVLLRLEDNNFWLSSSGRDLLL